MDARIADAAGKLLKDVAFKAACEKVEEKYSKEWRLSEPHQTEARERAYQRTRALIDLLQNIRSFYEEGEAEKEAAAKRDRASKLDL